MKITLSVLGVRGAIPTANKQFMEYGGNTSCISLEYENDLLCFDAGSGLANLGDVPPRVKRLHILISHLHMDHILGLYHASALSVPEIHLYGGGEGFWEKLETAIGRPYWPIGLHKMGKIQTHDITGQESFSLVGDGGIQIATLQGNHPGGSILYRAQLEGKRITHALDCEMNEEIFSRLAEFAEGSDLLIWDANFTNADKQPGWGHSTWEEGLSLKKDAGAKKILMTHYARDYTDLMLQEQERLAGKEDNACIFAREGMVVEL